MSNENDNEFPPGEGAGGEGVPLSTGRPAVASAPGKMLFIVLGVLLFVGIIIKSLFFGTNTAVEKPPSSHREHVAPSLGSGDFSGGVNNLPTPPQPDSLSQANNPPPPPPPPPIQMPAPEINTHSNMNEALQKRIHAGLIASGSGSLPKLGMPQKKSAGFFGSDPNSSFAQAVTDSTSAQRVDATNIGNLNITIAQGKIIHGVLETAIDTDLPGPIRALVTHDTYAEAGRQVLIPKGTRLIGTYNSSVKRGQGRVFIIWQRLIRPDGTDILINSPGIDLLGRAGMQGDVDNKYFEMFSTALLTSTLDIGVAAVGDGLFGNQQTTTVYNGSGTTTTSSPTAAAMQQAIQNIGSVGNSIVGSVLNLQPTIYIDQGTLINIFANKELIFPNGDGHLIGFIE